MQIKGANVKFPLTIAFSGVIISQVDPQASAKMMIDVGMDPQPEQVWEVNQDVELAGNKVRLISITAQRDGYSFRIDPGENLSSVSIQIEGHPANGGGGGGGWQGIFTSSLVYFDLPQREIDTPFLQSTFSQSHRDLANTMAAGRPIVEFPTIDGAATFCLNADTFQEVIPLPAGLDGKVVYTQLNPQLQIMIAGMDGHQQQVLAAGSGRAALTLDGNRMAYGTNAGIRIQDMARGEFTMMTGVFGRDLHWSHDGNQIAYVNSGDVDGVFRVSIDGKDPKQLSNLGYKSDCWMVTRWFQTLLRDSRFERRWLPAAVSGCKCLEIPRICSFWKTLPAKLQCLLCHRMESGSHIGPAIIAAYTSKRWMELRHALYWITRPARSTGLHGRVKVTCWA